MDDVNIRPDPVLPPDDVLWERFVTNECSPSERAHVETWLRLNPEQAAYMAEWRIAAKTPRPLPAKFDIESVRSQFWTQVRSTGVPNEISSDAMEKGRRVQGAKQRSLTGNRSSISDTTQKISRRHFLPGWVLGAATAVILGVVAIHSTITNRVTRPLVRSSQVYATGTGQTTQVTLADGSKVTIAPQSQLTIAQDFGAAARTVTLTGEAYFDVSHRVGTPFLVRTGRISTRVLGTTFDVRYYPADSAVRVAVLSGRVVASGAHATAHLTAGLIGHVTDSTATTTNGDVTAVADWRTGRLVFDDTPVATVLANVGRWYGYDFVVPDSMLAKRRVMATFRINDSKETLADIEYLLNVTMTFDGTKVIVRPRQSRGAAPTRRDTALLYSTPREVGK